MDGHTSHSNCIELLYLASENDVIIVCLPSHTTQALQPLDRSFFKPLKMYYSQEAHSWMLRNKDRTITRLQVGALIGKAWGKAATVRNATSGFRACGIFPLNPNVIPDHFFAISDQIETAPSPVPTSNTKNQSSPKASESGLSAMLVKEKCPANILEEECPIPNLPTSTVKRK